MNVFGRLGKFSVLGFASLLATIGSAQVLQSSHQPTVKATTAAVAPAGKAVARVNGVAITQAEYDQEMRRIFPYFSMHGNAIPDAYVEDVRKKAINNLINTELVYQEAKRRNLQITPVEWQKRIAEVRKDYRSKAEFDAAIKKLFGTRAAFDERLRHDMLLDKIFLVEVKRKAAVSDADVLKEYQANKASFVLPEHISFQSISTMFPKNATQADKDAARKRIEQILPQAKAAKDYDTFGVLAEKVSEDEFRVMMGDHKMVHRGSLDSHFEVAFSMKEGEVSGIIESPVGFHIIRLNKHQQKHQMTYAEVRVSLKENMQKDRLAARNKAFHDQLRKNAKVEIL